MKIYRTEDGIFFFSENTSTFCYNKECAGGACFAVLLSIAAKIPW